LGLQLQLHAIHGYVRVSLEDYKPPQPDQIGGVIVCGAFDEQYMRMFGSEGVPVVSVDFWSHDPNVDSVVVDVESDAYMVIDHLSEKGHTSLGFVATGRQERGSDIFEYDPDIWRFLDSLRRVAQRQRIEMRDEWVRMPVKSRAQPYQSVRELLNMRDVPGAVICFDDQIAVPTLKAIEDAGLRCPEDISVMARGADDDASGLITRLVSDPQVIGRHAVRLLVERMQGQRRQAIKVAVATRLALGKSTGPAPRRRSQPQSR
jgi:DNA-binding LacI/PurR family transcriptional regulator